MRGEHEPELSHAAAKGRAGFHQVGMNAGFGQVDGRPHSPYAPADHQDAAGLVAA
jgi:hypothetical protein